MARDTSLSADVGQDRDSTHSRLDPDLVSALWEQAPFARLPPDAPHELRDFLADVDNPNRVYTIHKASRRHGLQLLVQNYIIQLREGCGDVHCTTSTCFTCRKRVAGRAPVRRLSPTSARTLAICLAQQDNAENGLCPSLAPPKTAPAAVNSLLFTPNTKPTSRDKRSISVLRGHNAGSVVLERGNPRASRSNKGARRGREAGHHVDGEHVAAGTKADFFASEQPARKDYRSFAAHVFSTVSFKMLEWLTPNGMAEMHRKTETFQPNVQTDARENHDNESKSAIKATDAVSAAGRPGVKPTRARSKEGGQQCQGVQQSSRPGKARRNSNTPLSRQHGQRPKRQLSVEPTSHEGLGDEPFANHLKSPKRPGPPVERCLKTTNPIPRPISQLSSAGFFDEVKLEKMPPPLLSTPKVHEKRSKLEPARADGPRSSESSSLSGHESNVRGSVSDKCCSDKEEQTDSKNDSVLPQTLARLSPDVINFVCDVLQEDGTSEKHVFEPANVSKIRPKCTGQGKALKRRSRPQSIDSPNLKFEWHLFIEQSLFYVLSDANLVVRSFSKKGVLYDSHTLWYCMLRMTRVAPSLLFHSLWLAAASLFAAPKSLQSLRSPTARLFPRHEEPLSSAEAGCLMSVCLHALVAAGPLVSRAQDFLDVSRIRSHGLSLGSGAVAQPPVSLSLQYDDAFTNELALRLARRLFSAITTRRYFDEMMDSKEESSGHHEEPDVLAPIFSQLNFMNPDSVYILDFPFSERTLHETRVPSLLLDWSKTIIMNDWNGNPEVPGDGSFGGALALIEAMHQRRQELALGDNHFKCEYFAERLDDVDMPVTWLSHVSTRQKRHLLDFPFLFNSSTLVSYFRSIHFSRMSRSFEESNSLQTRIGAVTNTGSLVVNSHHKDLLHDLLKTASAKYLVLDISREHVVRDTFDQLWRRDERELLRPLKVHLGERNGEEGLDSGGVQLEFFRLAMSEMLNPDYGMFTVDERTRMTWFQPGSIEAEWKFEMVGLLLSLAVYNGLTLPVTFPKALYRKLLGEPVNDLQHMADGWPDLASGLSKLLEWDERDGLVEDVFLVTYEFSVSVLGKPVTRKMRAEEAPLSPSRSQTFFSPTSGSATPNEEWPQFSRGGWPSASDEASSAADDAKFHDAPLVTKANRDAYVADYVRYLTDVSVRPQYEAFARGFRACLHPKSLSLLSSNLLQSVVEGVQDMDVSELQRHARHVGWDATHETVTDFWSIVSGYDDAMKRRLLEFVTASDRVPVGGIKNLQFILQKNGIVDHDGGHLPTAYTCYGTLLLPEYRDRNMLEERLNMALQNAQGFGFG